MNGYIKLFRKIRDWEWYRMPNTKVVFMEILLTANIRTVKYRGQSIVRGSLLATLDDIASATGLTKDEVRTALKNLKMSHTITTQKYMNKTLINVLNYELYQVSDAPSSHTNPSDIPTQLPYDSHTVPTPNEEEEKEEKEGKEEIPPSTPPIPYEKMRDEYNRLCPDLPKCTRLSDKRKSAISARLRSGYALDDFTQLFAIAQASDFLRGKNKRNWCADFDWLISDANMAKVLEGKYNNRDSANNQPRSKSFSELAAEMDGVML